MHASAREQRGYVLQLPTACEAYRQQLRSLCACDDAKWEGGLYTSHNCLLKRWHLFMDGGTCLCSHASTKDAVVG